MQLLFIFIGLLSVFISAQDLSDIVVKPTSIRAMGRGGAAVAEPYGADSLNTNPAGLAQQGSGLHYYNLDFEGNVSNESSAFLFHRKSFGVGRWAFDTTDLSVGFLVLVLLGEVEMALIGALITKPLMLIQTEQKTNTGPVILALFFT